MKVGYTEIDGKHFYFAENGEMQIEYLIQKMDLNILLIIMKI